MSRDDNVSRNLGHTKEQVWGSSPQGLLCSDCAQMYRDRELLLPDIDCICEGGNGGLADVIALFQIDKYDKLLYNISKYDRLCKGTVNL